MNGLIFSHHSEESLILSSILSQFGYPARATRSLEQVVETWTEHPADFVILVSSGEVAGLVDAVRLLRGCTIAPVLVIGEGLSEDEQIVLFEAGLDLYIPRPFSLRLLRYQVQALLRRSNSIPFQGLPGLNQSGVVLDPAARTVRVGERPPRHLTQLEFRLLYTLMTHAGQIIPYEQIINQVWQYSGEESRELVRGLVQRLRLKVEPEPQQPVYILTEPGVGYYFCKVVNHP